MKSQIYDVLKWKVQFINVHSYVNNNIVKLIDSYWLKSEVFKSRKQRLLVLNNAIVNKDSNIASRYNI